MLERLNMYLLNLITSIFNTRSENILKKHPQKTTGKKCGMFHRFQKIFE